VLLPALLRADGSRHRFLWPAETFTAPVTEARPRGPYHRPSVKAACCAASRPDFSQIADLAFLREPTLRS
jgi:hypothetical protein